MHDTRVAESAVFWWWDDALREAHARAAIFRRKFTVRGFEGMWRICPAPHKFPGTVTLSRSEVCS